MISINAESTRPNEIRLDGGVCFVANFVSSGRPGVVPEYDICPATAVHIGFEH